MDLAVILFLITAFAPRGPSARPSAGGSTVTQRRLLYRGSYNSADDDRTDQLCPEQLSFRPAH